MKHKYIYMFIACSLSAQTFKQRFDQLMQNPRYKNMSALEIAIEIEDFPAISHFEYQTPLNALMKAQELLKGKIDIMTINIKDQEKKYAESANKGTELEILNTMRARKKQLTYTQQSLQRRIREKKAA